MSNKAVKLFTLKEVRVHHDAYRFKVARIDPMPTEWRGEDPVIQESPVDEYHIHNICLNDMGKISETNFVIADTIIDQVIWNTSQALERLRAEMVSKEISLSHYRKEAAERAVRMHKAEKMERDILEKNIFQLISWWWHRRWVKVVLK